MTRKKLVHLLLTNHGLFIFIASYVLAQDPYSGPGQRVLVGAALMAMTVSFVALLCTYHAANREEDPMPPRWPLRIIHTITAIAYLVLWGVNSRQYYYPGGDVDPIAYQQNKTSYLGGYHLLEETGGYHLLADANTYRTLVSSNPYVELPSPLARYKVLSHVPSIFEIKEQKISLNMPHTSRKNECTLSLIGAVVHLPFDEARVGDYLHHMKERWNLDPIYDMTSKLEDVLAPILNSITEPLPEGTLYVQLDRTEGILGFLEEKYGFRIVPHTDHVPLLRFTIRYIDEPPTQDQILLLPNGEEIRVSTMNEFFPPRKKQRE